MTTYLGYFIDGAMQGQNIASALLVLLMLAAFGGVIGGRARTIEADVFVGWGAITLVFTAASVFLSGPLGVLSWLFFGGGIACTALLLRRDGTVLPAGSLKVLVLLSPLLLLAGAMAPSQWDEFSHWLAAPLSLFSSGDVPSDNNPQASTVSLAAYPYGWPYLTFLASRASGLFMDGAGRIYNIVFLALFGLLALKVTLRAAGRDAPERTSWRLAGLATFFIAVINPTFIEKIVLTAYADTGTAVVLGFTAYLLWILLDAIAEGDHARARKIAWQAAFVGAALINIKQVNLVLFAGLVLSYLIAAWRSPQISLGRAFRLAIGFSILPLLVYMIWRYHVAVNISGATGSEATLMPYEQWNTGVIGQIMLQMLVVAGKKFAFFAVMAIATVFAVVAFFRTPGHYGRLAILAGGSFVSYNTFLLFTYVASFGERVALTAVSFWRYNTHLGMIAVLVIAAGGGLLWRRWDLSTRLPTMATWLPVLLVIAAPLIFAQKLRFDLEPNKPHYTAVARELAEIVSPDRPMVIIDTNGTGESAVITRYYMKRKNIPYVAAFQKQTLEVVQKMMRMQGDQTQVLIHSITPEIKRYFAGRLSNGNSYLLTWDEDHWRVVRQWPYPKKP